MRRSLFTHCAALAAAAVFAPAGLLAASPFVTPPLTYRIGNYGNGLTVGDFDGDGDVDVAALDWSAGQVKTLHNQGDGRMAAATVRASIANPIGLIGGRVNGDGYVDLLVVGGDRRINALLAQGSTGAFESAGSSGEAIRYGVAIGDLNGDGKPDYVAGQDHTSGVRVALGNGDGTFGPATAYYGGVNPGIPLIRDLNHDDKPDVLINDVGNDTIIVLPGNGDGTFGQEWVADAGAGVDTRSPALADFNRDGNWDVATGSIGNYVSVQLGLGDGTFGAPRDLLLQGDPNSVAAADFDADGRDDLAVLDIRTKELKFLAGLGDGTFAAPTIDLVPTAGSGDWARHLTAADFDGNGSMDLAALTDNGQLSIFLTPVPEPVASTLAGGLAGAMLLARRRPLSR